VTRRVRLAGRLTFASAALLVILGGSAGTVSAVSGIAWPVQSLGDRGTDVLAIQHLLRARLGSTNPLAPPIDALFGASTDAAVRGFQTATGMRADGIVDWATWGKLIGRVQAGSGGEIVVALQVELIAKRHASISATGGFGSGTKSALTAFQRHMGLSATGVADTTTWRALVWHFELPGFGSSTGLCDYSVGNGPANWGTAEAISATEAVGRTVQSLGFGRIAVGDVSLEHGGPIPGHDTHRRGLDVDIRPLRMANDQCSIAGTTWRSTAYDRAATRQMIQRFRAVAPGHIKVIYFNDPILIGEGLTTWFSGHDDHIHVRFCEVRYALTMYDC
jgi:peptidoglycan hydrolase-like protein with peptidoglycan-binding domain